MKQVDLQRNDIGIEANEFSDKALEQIEGIVRPILNEKDKEIKRLKEQLQQKDNIIKEVKKYMKDNIRVKLNEEFGETMQYKTIYEKLDEEE